MISLKCDSCDGVMEVDEGREILTCPYCGSKNLLPLSDEVRIAMMKEKTKLEKLKYEHEEIEKENRRKYILIGVCLAIPVIWMLILQFT